MDCLLVTHKWSEWTERPRKLAFETCSFSKPQSKLRMGWLGVNISLVTLAGSDSVGTFGMLDTARVSRC